MFTAMNNYLDYDSYGQPGFLHSSFPFRFECCVCALRFHSRHQDDGNYHRRERCVALDR